MTLFARRAGILMKLVLPLSLLLLALPAGAQDSSAMAPRRLLLAVAADPAGSFTADELLMVSRSMLLRIHEASTDIEVVESTTQPAVMDAEALDAAMRSVGADGSLSLTLTGTWSALQVRAVSLDMLEKTTVLDVTIQREGWSSSQDIADEGWDDVVRPLARGYHKVAMAAASTEPRLVRLAVRALPGTLLFGPAGVQRVADEQGLAVWDVPGAQQYSLRSRLPGYHPITESIFLSGDREIALKQVPDPAWSFDVSLIDISAPGIDLSRNILPGVIFARLGVTTALVTLDFGSGGLLSSEPLSILSFQVGAYILPEDAFFRFYAGVAAFARVVHLIGVTPYFDPVAPGGICGVFGGEFFASQRGAFFAEWTPIIYKTDFPEILKAMMGSGDLRPGWTFGSYSASDVLSVRMGYRWNL